MQRSIYRALGSLGLLVADRLEPLSHEGVARARRRSICTIAREPRQRQMTKSFLLGFLFVPTAAGGLNRHSRIPVNTWSSYLLRSKSGACSILILVFCFSARLPLVLQLERRSDSCSTVHECGKRRRRSGAAVSFRAKRTELRDILDPSSRYIDPSIHYTLPPARFEISLASI